ncbi:MAG TPA: hypothetical protein VIJ63_16205 [Roseiarcus sp.]
MRFILVALAAATLLAGVPAGNAVAHPGWRHHYHHGGWWRHHHRHCHWRGHHRVCW